MNRRRGRPVARTLAILSFAATAGLPVLFLLMRLRVFAFRDDFTGFNALGFALGWALVLVVIGTVLGVVAWRVDPGSWLARFASAVNGLLLAGLLWLLVTLAW